MLNIFFFSFEIDFNCFYMLFFIIFLFTSTAVPEFNTKAEKHVAYTDNSTVLNCLVQGYPSVDVTWYRNGIPVSPAGDSHAVLKNNSIVLHNLNWEDAGVFQCGAENFAGLFFVNLELEVQSKILFSYFVIFSSY